MSLPPLPPILPNFGAEMRITTRLKKYWDFLRGDKFFPSEKDIKPQEIESIWNNCFVVKADNSCRKEDYRYKHPGKDIIKAYGSDLTGLTVDSIASVEASHLADKYELVLARKTFVMHEDEFNTPNNEILKYRQILLPLGEDGVNITAILGGMSYKIVPQEKKSFFSRFSGKN